MCHPTATADRCTIAEVTLSAPLVQNCLVVCRQGQPHAYEKGKALGCY